MTDDHLPYRWRERLLQMLIAPANAENLRFLDAWAQAEGGTATNNPLNTTYPLPWSSNYNTTGVKNYGTRVEGICATAITLARESPYLSIWKDLQNGGHTAEQIVLRNRDALKRWGTSPELVLKVLAGT